MTLNRRERRAGWPEKVVEIPEHVCESMRRHKELDHHVKSTPCLECGGSTEVEPDDCPHCNNGTVPATDYFGYECKCGKLWVQMQYVLKGKRFISWRSLDDLRVGDDRQSRYPFGKRQ